MDADCLPAELRDALVASDPDHVGMYGKELPAVLCRKINALYRMGGSFSRYRISKLVTCTRRFVEACSPAQPRAAACRQQLLVRVQAVGRP